MSRAVKLSQADLPIPTPHAEAFRGAIQHPALWLWDSWVIQMEGSLNLYCLALSRVNGHGQPITPYEFNDYMFHYRHFESNDDGASWRDRGAVLHPGNLVDGSDNGNIWSGGVHPLAGGKILYGFTGIEHASANRQFIQSPTFAVGTVDGPEHFPDCAQSHPVRDHARIVEAGYYLPDQDAIGSNEGEADGPILAWRDPCIFDDHSTLRAVWSAKVGPREPCVAHAVLVEKNGEWSANLQPPIILPDASDYTQAEVPKLCWDTDTETWLMMISACDRLHEQQPDSEITKSLRLYRSKVVTGPWQPALPHGSILSGVDHLFGASFVDKETSGGSVRIIAPFTIKIGLERAMSFAPIQPIQLG